ncbi:MAG: response regulator, partial [Nitrospirae bacterium]|nr:response regulator [Nitrospirota bacterium]
MTAIIGCSEFLQEEIPKDSPLRTYVDMISTSADRAANLTRGLLAYSRKQITHRKVLSLNETVKKIEGLITIFIGEGIELILALDERDLRVMADSNQIEQVVMNLVSNAKDAMPDGGTLTIHTGARELGRDFFAMYGSGEPGTYAVVSVKDTGTGMDAVTREKIFEPFFTTKGVGKGTGLGLSMVYGVIQKHNGFIDVQSVPGGGSTFSFYLPLVSGEREDSGMTAELPVRGGTETILFAEDNGEVRAFVSSLLRKSGYTVIEAVDGDEAVEKMARNRDGIRLFLCDLGMPKKSGNVAVEETRRIRPDLKVIFMSGHPDEVIQEKGIIVDGFKFISKPVSPRELLRSVRSVLDAEH